MFWFSWRWYFNLGSFILYSGVLVFLALPLLRLRLARGCAQPGQAKDEPLRGPPPEATASCRPQEDQASPLNLNLNLGQAPVQDQPQPASALAKPLQSSNALDKSLISYFES